MKTELKRKIIIALCLFFVCCLLSYCYGDYEIVLPSVFHKPGYSAGYDAGYNAGVSHKTP